MNSIDKVRDRLIVGLDLLTVKEAERVLRELEGTDSFYKISYQLAFAGCLDFARELTSGSTKVFLDIKLLNINNTVDKGVENIIKMAMAILMLHACPEAMKATVEAARGSELCLLAVIVLTSMDEKEIIDADYEQDPYTLVLRWAGQAVHAKVGDIVCSTTEASAVRCIVALGMAVVTPGIRPDCSDHGYHKRLVTSADSIRNDSSYLVVARPIIDAVDTKAAA